jgi:proteasome lid subunit RPN8/RPN11
MNEIWIPPRIIKKIADHAAAAHPTECCGVLGGRDGVVVSWRPTRNAASDPLRRYEIAPPDVFRIFRAMRAAGESLAAIYHSHPRTPPRPSPTDVAHAFYPDAAYLIFSPAHNPSLQGYRICNGRVSIVEIIVA